MMKAYFVRDLTGFNGQARLYRTEANGYLAVSSVAGSWANETMVFPADEDGNVTDWLDIGVAYPNGNFGGALADAGYEEV